ncbi:MAG: winged helix DNA-binding domain-containing protein, partial [Chloroflexota bacterium]|nr:winged helix DNA-binding domain-containing protein [Chloroflexota bacterium]
MPLTARHLNRATLGRQLLLRREPLGVIDAVRRVVALQAQEAASPYLALWARVADFDPADLDAAFATHAVVKASLIRLTLHAVVAEDYPATHNAMLSSLRASRLNDRRFTTSGLSTADADELVSHLVEFAARPRSKAEIEALLATRLGGRNHPRAWWALKMFAPLHHAPTGGPWSFGTRSSFVDARTTLDPESADESVQRLVLRYLEAFGPASV